RSGRSVNVPVPFPVRQRPNVSRQHYETSSRALTDDGAPPLVVIPTPRNTTRRARRARFAGATRGRIMPRHASSSRVTGHDAVRPRPNVGRQHEENSKARPSRRLAPPPAVVVSPRRTHPAPRATRLRRMAHSLRHGAPRREAQPEAPDGDSIRGRDFVAASWLVIPVTGDLSGARGSWARPRHGTHHARSRGALDGGEAPPRDGVLPLLRVDRVRAWRWWCRSLL